MNMRRTHVKLGLIAIAVFVSIASAQIARAETIFLKCGDANHTVDLAANTVDNHSATINETAIDWAVNMTYSDGTPQTDQYHIDRTTGTLTDTITICFHTGGYKGTCRTNKTAPVACTAGSAPPKKF
jgi:hypothetical protein